MEWRNLIYILQRPTLHKPCLSFRRWEWQQTDHNCNHLILHYTLGAETIAGRKFREKKNREIAGINFREWCCLPQISWQTFAIEKKSAFSREKTFVTEDKWGKNTIFYLFLVLPTFWNTTLIVTFAFNILLPLWIAITFVVICNKVFLSVMTMPSVSPKLSRCQFTRFYGPRD